MIKPVATPAQAELIAKLQHERMRPKFSRNLANFVKTRLTTKVFLVTPLATAPSWETGDMQEKAPKGRVNSRRVFLSDRENPWSDNYFHGTSLNNAICQGGSARCYARNFKQKDWKVEDITEKFWADYAKLGKCLWDWKHEDYGFVSRTWSAAKPNGDDERFKAIDDQTVKCKWCADVLHLRRTVHVEIRVRHKWLHAKVDGVNKTFRCTRCHRRHPIADLHQEMKGYGPIKGPGVHQPQRTEIKLTQKGMCPRCFIATTASGNDLKALLPTEILVPLNVNT